MGKIVKVKRFDNLRAMNTIGFEQSKKDDYFAQYAGHVGFRCS